MEINCIAAIMRANIIYLYFIVFLASGRLTGQVNLVNNPSFEALATTNVCPEALDQLNRCSDWTALYATPDYYNSCGALQVGVPQNYFNYQVAASGQAYAGFIALYQPPTGEVFYAREYLGISLSKSLLPGTRYYLSMKFNMAEHWQDVTDDNGWNWGNNSKSITSSTLLPTYLPCNNIGMKFCTKSHNLQGASNPYAFINNVAHLYSHDIISDTTNWKTIQGSFIADSAYTHLIIGNFFINTATISRPHAMMSYYFVDDIIVSTDSTVITGLEDPGSKNSIARIYPNPVVNTLHLELAADAGAFDWRITNAIGRNLLESTAKIQDAQVEIDLSLLQSGLYYLEVIGQNGKGVYKFFKE